MRVVALSGGVGGARLVDGLAALDLDLSVIINTGDDFEHWGLHIAPDVDTVLYTLAGLAPVDRGWGLTEESFEAMGVMERLGGAAWFRLGDRDLGLHLARTSALREGGSLSAFTERCRQAFDVAARLLPMSDAPSPTRLRCGERVLGFQDWLVREGAPAVDAVLLGTPDPAPGVLEAIEGAELVVIPPSNPYVSVDPILEVRGVREALQSKRVVAVSPIVGGRAIKGPLASMIPRLAGRPASAQSVVEHYQGLLDGAIVEAGDALEGLPCLSTQTIMGGRADRARLAREVIDFARSL